MCCVSDSVYAKQFAKFLGVVVILLFNLMELLSWGGGGVGALLDRPCMRVCVIPVIAVYIKMLLP